MLHRHLLMASVYYLSSKPSFLEEREIIMSIISKKELLLWNNFEECLLQNIQFVDFTSSVILEFNYIWSAEGAIRDDIESVPKIVKVVCRLVHELHFIGGLTVSMCQSPAKIDWGLSEVSSISINEEQGLEYSKYTERGIPIVSLCCHWEGSRKLEIICSSIDIKPLKKNESK